MKQMELAEKIGVHQSVLSEAERGDVRLHAAVIIRLAQALKVTTDEILGLKDTQPAKPVSGRLLRRLERIETLPRAKQRVVLEMVDAFLDKHAKADRR